MRALILTVFLGALVFKFYTVYKDTIPKPGYANKNNYADKVKKTVLDDASIYIKDLVFNGLQGSKLPYKIESSSALQMSDQVFDLSLINATYSITEFQELKILANKGIVDRNKRILSLQDQVKITSSDYSLSTKNLEMDFDKSYIQAKNGVDFRSAKTNIHSDKCKLFNNSQNLKCHGSVEANIIFNGF
jgi:hypothetical protein